MMWGWPYSLWFILWIFLFFGQFFGRLATMWAAFHGISLSPSYSTLTEVRSLARAYDRMSLLDPLAVAEKAAMAHDFRLIDWPQLRVERYDGPLWYFAPWPIRVEPIETMDISYKEVEGICENAPLIITNPTEKPPNYSQSHPIETYSSLCSFVDDYLSSKWILEERGYNGSGPNIPREAAAFFMRFNSFIHTYNNVLRAHPKAPSELKHDLFLRKRYGWEDYELYRDFLPLQVPKDIFKEWISWD